MSAKNKAYLIPKIDRPMYVSKNKHAENELAYHPQPHLVLNLFD